MKHEWMKLDNAAKIYPLIESEYITTVYRFSATLDVYIIKSRLLEALNRVIVRFPYYKVTLKRGFFWYYLEENHKELDVYQDIKDPCRRMIKEETNGYLFRVLYKNNKISVEFNHILADGTACLIFLNTLVHEYLRLSGYEVSLNEWIKDINSEIDEKEYEDTHSIMGKRYLKSHNKKDKIIKNVFHLKDRLIKRDQYNVIYGIINAFDIHETAKKHNCSITILLTAIYLQAMVEIQNEQIKKARKRKPVAIQVPINMRKRIQSNTMRNFSLYITPSLTPDKDYTLTEIIDFLNQYFKEKTDIDSLLKLEVQNYKTEKTLFVRLLPLMLKTVVTPFIYKAVGADTFSGTISNIGLIKLPESIEKHVERIDFVLGPCPLTKCSCAVTGYKNNLYISFGRNTKIARVETIFFRKLVQLGLKVQIENHGGDNI